MGVELNQFGKALFNTYHTGCMCTHTHTLACVLKCGLGGLVVCKLTCLAWFADYYIGLLL